jgi:hypothetical protein
MPFISFNKATEPAAPDDLRINTAAVLYVEASRPDLVGQTLIHMLGQGSTVNAVTESIGTVVSTDRKPGGSQTPLPGAPT